MAIYKVDQGGKSVGSANSSTRKSVPQGKLMYVLSGGREPEVQTLRARMSYGVDDNGNRRPMRLCVNSKSVWLDEQEKNAVVAESPTFSFGRLMVNPSSFEGGLLYEFLERHISNKKNGGYLFELYNEEEIAEKEVSWEDLVLDAKFKVRQKLETEAGINELRFVAKGLRMSCHDKSVVILKNDLLRFAGKKPKEFLEAFEDKFIQAQALIAIAEEEGKVVYDGSKVRWDDGGEIVKIPKGRNWKDYFAEFITHPENIDVFKEFVKIEADLKKKTRKK